MFDKEKATQNFKKVEPKSDIEKYSFIMFQQKDIDATF